MIPNVGWYYTFCCCDDAGIIKDEKELNELLNDGDRGYSFFQTAEELCKYECSCEGECVNLEKLKSLKKI